MIKGLWQRSQRERGTGELVKGELLRGGNDFQACLRSFAVCVNIPQRTYPTSKEETTFGAVEPVTLIPALFIILAASVVKSTAGFGFALVATPFLLLMWAPRLVVPILLPLFAIVDAMIVIQGRHHLEWRRILPMVAAAALGIPLGNYILLAVPELALTLAMASMVLLFAALLLMGYTINIHRERLAGGLAGFLSGTLVTSTTISGPPVTLFMINQRWEKETFRTGQGLFHLAIDGLAIASLSATRLLTVKTLLVDLALLPVVLLGYAIAVVLLPHIRQELFRRLATLIVIVAAVMAIGSELTRI